MIPLRVADYCVVSSTGDQALQAILAMRMYPYKIYYACAVPHNGVDPLVTKHIAKFLWATGVHRFVDRCDRESALNSMLECAISETARHGVWVDDDAGIQPSDFPIAVSDEDDDEPDAPEDLPKPLEGLAPRVCLSPLVMLLRL